VFKYFLEFQTLFERLFNHKILSMQSDWGGEYEKLNSFFRTVGISHFVSCPHTHQQNSVIERKHRHIVEMGLALLANASMPPKYWDQAFLAAIYLINRMPIKVIGFDTPMNKLFAKKLDYSSMRIFGCFVGLILGPTMLTSSNIDPNSVCSWGIETCTRASNVMTSSKGASIFPVMFLMKPYSPFPIYTQMMALIVVLKSFYQIGV
jgi:hypothetical protein